MDKMQNSQILSPNAENFRLSLIDYHLNYNTHTPIQYSSVQTQPHTVCYGLIPHSTYDHTTETHL